MKKNRAYLFSLLFFFAFIIQSYGQRNSFDKWFVDVNFGPTVFIGDIRSADYFPSFDKPAEIGFAFGGMFGKELGEYFNVRSQFIYGKLAGSKPAADFNFKTNFYSFGIGTELNLGMLFTGNTRSNLQLYGTLGASYLFWDADLLKTSTSALVINDKAGAFAIPVGLKISYEISPKLYLTVEGDLHVVTSDMVDAKVGGITHDDINYNYIGLTYKFDKKKKRRKPLSRSQLVATSVAKEPVEGELAKADEAVTSASENKEVTNVSQLEAQNAKEEAAALQQAELNEQQRVAQDEKTIIANIIEQERHDEIMGQLNTDKVDYKVRILTSIDPIDPNLLQKEYKISQQVIERKCDDGTFNYVVGSYDRMWKAKEQKNILLTRHKVKNAEVVLCKNTETMRLSEVFELTTDAQKQSVYDAEIHPGIYKMEKLENTVPSSGLVIGVQILAVKKQMYPIQALIDGFDIDGPILVDKLAGSWSKFVVTGYDTLEEAIEAKEKFRAGSFSDAFIVVYYNGNRVAPSKIPEYQKK
ncbi:MAG: hypothetical protein JW729_08045 [Bacteroidales bacterium]|nr:hypothetical protein [Bacteroidales bacterium]